MNAYDGVSPLTDIGATEDAVAEVDRGGHRLGRAEQDQRGEAPFRPLTRLAAVDVAGDPLADQHRELAVPRLQDLGQLGTLLAPGASDAQGAEAALRAVAHAMQQAVALLGRHTERVGEIGALQPLADRELEHQLVARIEPTRGVPDELGELLVLGTRTVATLVRRGAQVSTRLREVGGDDAAALLGAPVDLVAHDREQPWLQTRRIAQLVEPFGRDDEHVLDDVGGVVPVAEHRRRRVVQRIREAVVDGGERGRDRPPGGWRPGARRRTSSS